jgi:hypothetical protein
MDPTNGGICTPYPPAGPDGSPLTFPPEWLTEPARSLAHGIRADAAFDIMPILADALEEAGCDDLRVLNHCRYCAHHRPDCWVLEAILPSGQLYWTGAMEDRLAAAVAAAALQGHPDDPDVIPGRVLPQRAMDEAEAEARAARRERAAVRTVWGCAAVVAFFLLLGFLMSLIRR